MKLAPPHRLLVRSATRAPHWTATAVLATAASVLATLLLPTAVASAVDSAITAGTGAGTLLTAATAWVLALVVTIALADSVGELSAGRATAAGTAWLRHRLVRHALTPALTTRRRDPGDTVSRLIGDAAEAGAAPALAVQLVAAAVLSLGALVALTLLGWTLALAFLAGVPLALLLARRFVTSTGEHALQYQQTAGELAGRLVDAAAGLRTIAACGTADRETDRVLAPLPALSGTGRALWRSQAGIAWRAGLVIPAVQLAVLAAAGSRLARGELTVGQLLAAATYAVLGLAFLHRAGLLMRLSRARACATRLVEATSDALPEPGWRRLRPGPGHLELRGVTVPGMLSDVSLTVQPGTCVAVVGKSGSGKSALAEVAGGLRRPDEGDVLLDGASLAGVDPADLADAVGYAFARPVLHGRTVGDAIAHGEVVTPSLVTAAARTAQAHEPLTRLPAGYGTPVTEAPMSGGELQRVGLARALLRSPRLLVLDDATSSLDAVTEARLTATMATALPRVTRLIVTHRIGTASRADLVVWLEDGAVVAAAAHRALLGVPGYRDVFETG